MYCHAIDYETKYYTTLLIKTQYKRNKKNQNVQCISMETREEDGIKINMFTRGGENTRGDATKKD
jgi:hypothetical protein